MYTNKKHTHTYSHVIHACTYRLSTINIPKCKCSYSIYAYKFMHSYIHVSIHKYLCIYVHICTNICPCMPAYVHVYIYAYVHTYVCMERCNVYECTYMYTCLHTFTHTCINIYTDICIHIQTHVLQCKFPTLSISIILSTGCC